MNRINTLLIVLVLLVSAQLSAQEQPKIPGSYSNIFYDNDGKLYFEFEGTKYYTDNKPVMYSIPQLLGNPIGTEKGVDLDFGDFKGTITYGLIPYGQAEHPLPVFRFNQKIEKGKTSINIIDNFRYPYDFVGWKEKEILTIGYRLADKKGTMIFDGEITLQGKGPFEAVPSIYEGPFISNLEPGKATIWFNTSMECKTALIVNGKTYTNDKASTYHEFIPEGLSPNSKYEYTVKYGELIQTYSFTTALAEGSREPFVFAYASDSRHGSGGGERRIYGANAYIMKKIAALAYANDARFFQFTGDMINGYHTQKEDQEVEYVNWKKSIEVFWHYMPYYAAMGNHEAMGYIFLDETGRQVGFIDGFPYETESAEIVYANAFVNPENGPISEDGSKYDPDPDNIDFPPYKESVFYYTYGNVAMVVLNSDYWYAPSLKYNSYTSGGLHAYIMDNQLQWLKKTIKKLERDKNIDHIFVTQHTPVFPNGGHAKDDMWYHGKNEYRTWVAGNPVEKGIIERRDEYLDILVNKSKKVVAILTGDEHNYNWLKITEDMPRYPDDYPHEKLKLKRDIYQVNNGAAGAPYYGQEVLPWSDHTQSFSVENALCLFYVNGDEIRMKVLNPDTLNEIDDVKLK